MLILIIVIQYFLKKEIATKHLSGGFYRFRAIKTALSWQTWVVNRDDKTETAK